MIRVIVTICFALTLLCPVFCLADTDRECSSTVQPDGDNCEAMSIGAVVEKSDFGTLSPGHFLPSLDGLLPIEPAKCGCDCRLPSARRYWRHPKPPPEAARRHALLQSFLF
jgi:hypothetical protein